MRTRASWWIVLAAVAAAPHGPAPAREAQPEHKCKRCRDTERVPCVSHDRRSRAYKPYCSACRAEPDCCKGVGWTPCPDCATEETKARAAKIRELYAEERKGENFYEWGEGFFLAACEHYRFKAAASHEECHEFHAVAEKAFDLFERIFGQDGVDDLQWEDKGHFLILSSRDQYLKYLDWYQKTRNVDENRVNFLREEGTAGARFVGERMQAIIRPQTSGEAERKEILLHRIAHGAGHLAIENYKVFGQTPPWLGEGWAGRSEIEALKSPKIYCVDYVAGGHQDRKPEEWRRIVRDAIRTRKLPTFDRLFQYESVGEMGSVEWAMSIGIVDWLVTKYPNKTPRLVDAIKDGHASKDAFEDVFGADLQKIEDVWKKWARVQR